MYVNVHILRLRTKDLREMYSGVWADFRLGQQEIQRKLQSYDWCGFSYQGGIGGRSVGDDAGTGVIMHDLAKPRADKCVALGYCRAREIPVVRCGLLQRSRLLCPGVRRQ